MINEEINAFTSRLVTQIGDHLESITFYPHPFTRGGLVIVPKDDVAFIPDLVSEIYECQPPAIALHCLRRAELFELSTPGLFGWPNLFEEKPHLAFWLKSKGTVLYGRDISDEINLSADTSGFLEIHLQRVRHCVRNWAFDQLWLKNHKGMVKEMELQARYLMATALLSRNEWEFLAEAVPERFNHVFDDNRANQVWAEIVELTRAANGMDETASRGAALEALWLFEQFIMQMGRHIQ